MKTIYLSAERAEQLTLKARAILYRLPFLIMAITVVYLFARDLYWPYHMLTHPWIYGFVYLLTDQGYRISWMNQYSLLMVVVLFALFSFGIFFKYMVWNRAFKLLRVRTHVEDELTDMELGRCYWIERRIHLGTKLREALRAMRIADIRIGVPGQRRMRRLKADLSADEILLTVEPPSLRARTIYYKPGFFPLLTPWNPARSMHRLVCTVTEEEIQLHDHNYILVVGQNLERDMRQAYPTFVLTRRVAGFVDLNVQQYREEFDWAIEKATATVTQASNMDTFLLKEQRKYQEITVRVDAEMADIVDKEEGVNGQQ